MLSKNFAKIIGLLFGSVGAHTYQKFEQVPPPPPLFRRAEFSHTNIKYFWNTISCHTGFLPGIFFGGGGEAISIVLGPSFRDCKSLQGGQKAWGGCPLPILEERHQRFNPISTGLFCLVVSLGGCFPPPFHNSFVFKVRLLKFCTELLSDRMNNLRWKKSKSNQQWRHYDVIFFSDEYKQC